MITRIREVRRARGMTLDDVARACVPPTTPQTIGRLIGRDEGKLHLLPPGAGGRQSVVTDPPWAAVAVRLVRAL